MTSGLFSALEGGLAVGIVRDEVVFGACLVV